VAFRRARSVATVKVLLITPYLPHVRVGHGGGTAVRNLAAELARLHDVHVFSLIRPGEASLVPEVENLGVGVSGVPFLDQSAQGWRRAKLFAHRLPAAGRALAGRYPYYVAKYGARGLVRSIVAEVQALGPDVVQVEYLQLALPLRELRRQRDRGAFGDTPPRLVLNSHELSSLPRRRRAAVADNHFSRAWLLAAASAWERLQVDATRWADATLCVTPQDHDLLASLGGVNLHTLPLGVDIRDVAYRPAAGAPPRALFLGSFQHPPNRSAARALVDDIWPRLHPQLPGWELVLAGPGSDIFVAGLSAPAAGIRGLGYVDDLGELFASCRMFLAPLTEGGGIKIKILEAMGRGLPVVTTPIGAEGITEARDDTLWLAPDIATFPSQALAAATQRDEALRRAERARQHIEANFSWTAIAEQLTAIYERI
jgi:glycosyltransferase involved in cell wall biosynthesis